MSDPRLARGARNAIDVCLRVRPSEKVTLITDRGTHEVAESLLDQIKRVGSPYDVFVLEDHGRRPMKNTPEAILRSLEASDVGIYCVWPQPGELIARMQVIDLVERKRIRYAHMVSITKKIMHQAMQADYTKIDEFSRKILSLVEPAKRIRVRTPAGTDLEAFFSPHLKWIKTSGVISPDYWSNLPGGEVFTAPHRVNGTWVVDGTIGDYLCEKYGDLRQTPLTLEIENNRLKSARCVRRELVEEFLSYCETDENSNRVGEFAIGTNLSVAEMIGALLQDEKFPGVHLAFGNPCPNQTGANWTSTTHIDVLARECDIWIDDQKIMEKGNFLFEQLDFDYNVCAL